MLFYLECWVHAIIHTFLSHSFYLSNSFYSSYWNIGTWKKERQGRTEKIQQSWNRKKYTLIVSLSTLVIAKMFSVWQIKKLTPWYLRIRKKSHSNYLQGMKANNFRHDHSRQWIWNCNGVTSHHVVLHNLRCYCILKLCNVNSNWFDKLVLQSLRTIIQKIALAPRIFRVSQA